MMHAEISIDGMTWGELREFVKLGSYLPNEAEVDQVYHPYESDEVIALSVNVVPGVDG